MDRRERYPVLARRGFREGTLFLRSTLRRGAELGHHPQVVKVVPDLCDLAAFESSPEDVGESNGFACCGIFLTQAPVKPIIRGGSRFGRLKRSGQ